MEENCWSGLPLDLPTLHKTTRKVSLVIMRGERVTTCAFRGLIDYPIHARVILEHAICYLADASVRVAARIGADTAPITRRPEHVDSDVDPRTASEILDAWGDERLLLVIVKLAVELAINVARGVRQVMHVVPV